MKSIFKYIKLDAKSSIALFVFVVMSAIFQMLLPSTLAKMINDGVMNNSTNIILVYTLIMAVITIFSCLVSFGTIRLSTNISTKFAYKLREKVFNRVNDFSLTELDKIGTASLITRSTSDITNVENFLTLLLRIGLLAPIMAVTGLVFSASTGGKVSFVLLFAIPVLLISLGIIVMIASRYSIKLRTKLDNINRLFLENLEGVRVIRAFNKEKYECERFGNINEDYTNLSIKSARVSSLLMPTITTIFGTTTSFVLLFGSYYVGNGSMEVASLVANSQYISMVLTSMMMLSMVIMAYPTSLACAKRIEEVINMEVEIKDGNFNKELRPLRSSVEFKNVSFKYPLADEAVLKNINFKCNKGETTAIIGGTGRGKSSILKLIPRFYDISEGEILIDGINIKDYKLNDLRSLIAYVPQSNNLFKGTIKDNLNFGNENGNIDDYDWATGIACASEFISKKEDGYEHLVAQKGTNLSGGQRQRLCIARALMKKAEIYLFDDSFSALDMKTDHEVRSNIKENLKDSAIIIVAQRISSIMDADQILVIDDGQIIACGKHEELMESCELYKEMAKVQLGGLDE